MTSQRIRVLESFPQPRSTTNPYITQLATALDETEGVELITYRPGFALVGAYDVFHVHWPENLVGGHKRIGRVARRLHAALLCVRLRLTRTPVVRTWHNLDRPDGLSRIDNAILDQLDALTVTRIRLNDVTDPADHHVATILHGHYRDWFSQMPKSERRPKRLTFAGLIRPYKGVEPLVRAFCETTDPALRLVIAGKADQKGAETLRAIAEGDERVSFDFQYVSEEELVRILTEAELTTLPYRRLHNSGAVLAALSLDRPVLVPDTAASRSLAAEVGEQWIIRYQGELTPTVLENAVAAASLIPRGERPDLSARDWSRAGEAHRRVFRRAIEIRRGH